MCLSEGVSVFRPPPFLNELCNIIAKLRGEVAYEVVFNSLLVASGISTEATTQHSCLEHLFWPCVLTTCLARMVISVTYWLSAWHGKQSAHEHLQRS